MADTEVLKYEDIILRTSDLDTLRDKCFLNDQIIAFYFTYLSSSINNKNDMLLVVPSVSIWIANCDDDKFVEEYAQSFKMLSKRLVLFAVNDNEDFSGGDSGSHWSILVYDRTKNLFLHFDSMEGMNSFHARKLYDAVKKYMGPGGEVLRPQTSSSSLKKQRNKKKSVPSVTSGAKATALTDLPMFMECKTPQQSNGYDCGLYVLAIARAICQWCSHEHNKSDIISTIEKNVDDSVDMKMRSEVLKIIKEMTMDI